MHKMITFAAYGAIAIILALLIGYVGLNYSSGLTDMSYPYGQTDKDKADAMNIVFSDSMINHSIIQAGRYSANVTVGGSFGDSGYIGLDGTRALVDISTVSIFPQTFHVLVDISSGQELEARYPYSILSKHTYVLLTHGATWYRSFMANETPTSINMEFEPQAATLRPIILDQANFDNYLCGQQFEPLRYTDSPSGGIKSYDGSIPVSSVWNTNVTLSGAGSPQKCYFVINNKELSRDMLVRLELKTN